jgi:hypothetical protein
MVNLAKVTEGLLDGMVTANVSILRSKDEPNLRKVVVV